MKRQRNAPDPAARPDADGEQDRLAVLIDADNAHAGIVDALLGEIASFGLASVKRIYGDWTQPQLGSWKKVLLQHSIVPVQQFAYTKGKNATDSALIIDAMDLMYTRRFDGFCLVSSDSDFTRLASRLREEGLLVYGFGEHKTPAPFVSACDKFVYTEVLRAASAPQPASPARRGAAKAAEPDLAGSNGTSEGAGLAALAGDELAAQATPALGQDPKALAELIANAVEAVSDDSGWAGLGAVGSTITKLRPDFDSRLYGHRKFSDLVRSMSDRFELEERASGAGKTIYVRVAPRPAGKPARKTRKPRGEKRAATA